MQDYPEHYLFTMQEAAKITQEHIITWRKRVSKKLIPVVRLGRNVRVSKQALEEFIRERQK